MCKNTLFPRHDKRIEKENQVLKHFFSNHLLHIFFFSIFGLEYTKRNIMANKRILKRNINNVCGELFAECIAISMYSSKTEPADVQPLLTSILVLNNEYIKRVSHPEPGMNPKAYYKHLVRHFQKETLELVDQIASLG